MKNKKTNKTSIINRRQFLKNSTAVTGTFLLAPTIVPSSVFGADAPSNRITFGCIGVGRMGLGDLREIMGFKQTRIVAVCDVDSNRIKHAQQLVDKKYQTNGECAGYKDFRDLIAQDDIDAVSISRSA